MIFGLKECLCKSWLAGVCKTTEIEQKRPKLVVASVKWHGCESACGEGRECRGRAGVAAEWQVLMESVGRKSGRLVRAPPCYGQKAMEKTWKMPHPTGEPEERKRGRTWEDEGG